MLTLPEEYREFYRISVMEAQDRSTDFIKVQEPENAEEGLSCNIV